MRPHTYLLSIAGTMLALAVLTIGFTAAVDPYRMFDTPVIAGWNALKPRVYDQAALAKTYQLERVAPRTLLLGNSRVEAGFDPESRAWPRAAQPVFNGAQAGTDLFSAWAMFRNAVAVNPPETVILGLDVIDFLTPLSTTGDEMRPGLKRMRVGLEGAPNAYRPGQWRRDLLAATLSIDAVIDSVLTIASQTPAATATMTPTGFNPLRETYAYLRRTGYHGHFAEKTQAYEKQFQRFVHPDFMRPAAVANFRALAAILDLAEAENCRVILFIHPYHAQFMDVMVRAGFGDDFVRWKHAVARIVAARRSERITLIDFSAPNGVTAEPVPRLGDLTAEMQWYWEAGHYKAALGDKMIARFMGADTRFGEILVPPAGARLAGAAD